MDEIYESFSSSSSDEDSQSDISVQKPVASTSGIKLVLPSLQSLRAAKVASVEPKVPKKAKRKAKRQKNAGFQEKRPPRPTKLKPLKEVLSRLIAQIRRKDDYAFFLRPVDVSKVEGYSNVVKYPMDFGTMSNKVQRGKYRSLEEFADDFRLVISNAKAFNPIGSIYYTEAERIEAWGLEHITKAASNVIQYETDWNIDIEKDDFREAEVPEEVEFDDPRATPAASVEGDTYTRAASPAFSGLPNVRRSTRGPYKKTLNAVSTKDAIDADGRMPGSKDGLGVFPPGSVLANTMLTLKLKAKKYKTKKERMRIEKEGPPLCNDGSLDYAALEDPFSILAALTPTPLTRPSLSPLYPPATASTRAGSVIPQSETPGPSTPFPNPTAISLIARPPVALASAHKHWNVIHNTNIRSKKDDDIDDVADIPAWKTPREAHATDFGSFALLAGELAEEMRKQGIPPVGGDVEMEEQRIFEEIRLSMDAESGKKRISAPGTAFSPNGNGTANGQANPKPGPLGWYWSQQRALEAEEYIRDVVYGGIDGLAYVRSLAEFVQPIEQISPTGSKTSLGLPLAEWVEQNIIDPLTEGRHSILRKTARQLAVQVRSRDQVPSAAQEDNKEASKIAVQVFASLYKAPAATASLLQLLQINSQKLDMGALIRDTNELLVCDLEWYGKDVKERRRANAVDGDGDVSMDGGAPSQKKEDESPEEIAEIVAHVAGLIADVNSQLSGTKPPATLTVKMEEDLEANDPVVPQSDSSAGEEDPAVRLIRINLLALAKRAPIDIIARLHPNLVPEQIRQFVASNINVSK